MAVQSLSSPWVKNSIYDLGFIFGGALLALLVPFIGMSEPSTIPFLFWLWVFAFEGSHFWATITRTYLDKDFREKNKPILLGSLVFFILPALAVFASYVAQNSVYMIAYGFFIFSWSLYHNTRQHYGFVSIYNRKTNANEQVIKKFKWGLYLATYAPMAHFFLNYKLKSDFSFIHNSLFDIIFEIPVALSFVSIGYFTYLGIKHVIGDNEQERGSVVAYFYIFTCLVFYNVMFFYVAAKESFLNTQNIGQSLMIVTIMNSLFHNIQYHAVVWYFSSKRYKRENKNNLGLAESINNTFPKYYLAALSFSLLFTVVFWLRNEIPFLHGQLGGPSNASLAFILYFGVVGHHFYLDQKIWKVSKEKDLKSYFSLKLSKAA